MRSETGRRALDFARAERLLILLCACGPNQTHPPRSAYQAPQTQTLSCLPELDGLIEASELQPALGVAETFLVSPAGVNRTVDVAGQVDASGARVWNWSTDLADDQTIQVSAMDLSTKYYAASFPAGQFTLPVDAAATLDAIYAEDSNAISLLGFASSRQLTNGTLLVYQQPVPVYRFPLQVGASWQGVGTVVNGSLQGLPYAGQDTYAISVDAAGQLMLPDLSFSQVLRVRTQLTVAPAVGNSVTRRQVSFLFECFGEVARATSQDGETNDDFTTAAEVRRLGI